MSKVIGIYAGSFDPVTLGHIDIIYRSFKFCDKLIIGIGENPNKNPLFSTEKRIKLIQESIEDLNYDITVETFNGLVVDYAAKVGARVLVRGVRSSADFEYEANLAQFNRKLYPLVETVMITTDPDLALVSSSAVKELARHGRILPGMVHPCVKESLKQAFSIED